MMVNQGIVGRVLSLLVYKSEAVEIGKKRRAPLVVSTTSAIEEERNEVEGT